MRKVVVVGGINIDIEARPFNKIIPHDSNPGRVKMNFGGVGRNIAENLSRLGGNVSMLSVVGNDHFGHAAMENLNALGIDAKLVEIVDGQSSSTYLSFLDDMGDMEVAVNDMEIVDTISPEYVLKRENELLKKDIICLDANLREDTLRCLAERFCLADKRLFLDPVSMNKCVRAKDFIGKFYAIKPNIMEAGALLDMEIRSDDDVREAAKRFMRLGVKKVFITLNKDGIYYMDESEEGFLRPRKNLKIVSATGAGDSVSACILYGLANDLNIGEIAEMGMAAAEITMESESACSSKLSLDEIKRRMER